jgi:hypothetical protein
MSPSNETRTQAENAIFDNLDKHKTVFTACLINLLKTAPEISVRSLCAVYLRKKLPRGEPIMYDELEPEVQAVVKTDLLLCIASETSNNVRNLIADTVAELAEVLVFKQAWLELVPFLYQCLQSDNSAHTISALNIFANLGYNSPDSLRGEQPRLLQAVDVCLTSAASPEVINTHTNTRTCVWVWVDGWVSWERMVHDISVCRF